MFDTRQNGPFCRKYTRATVYRDDLGHPSLDATTDASRQSSTIGGTSIHRNVFWDKRFAVEGGGYIYTVDDLTLRAVGMPTHGMISRAIANRKHGCRMVVGDPIQYAQEKDKLFILDPDGKECKLDIIRQERVQNTVSNEPAVKTATQQH